MLYARDRNGEVMPFTGFYGVGGRPTDHGGAEPYHNGIVWYAAREAVRCPEPETVRLHQGGELWVVTPEEHLECPLGAAVQELANILGIEHLLPVAKALEAEGVKAIGFGYGAVDRSGLGVVLGEGIAHQLGSYSV